MSFADRLTRRSFKPEARVYVLAREPQFYYDPPSGTYSYTVPEWLEIKEFLDVTVINSMTRPNSATVTLSNNRDRYSAKAIEVSRTTQRQREIIEYLKRVLSISEVRERNVERRDQFYALERQKKVKRSKKYYRQLDNGGIVSSGWTPSTRLEEYSNFRFINVDLDLMKRIWIDFKDRDDQWVAGFTGYISSLLPVFSPGQISTLTLSCKGMSTILQRSEIVYAEAIDPRGLPFEKEFASTGFEEMSNNLAGLDGDQIVQTVVGLSRDIYSFNTPNRGSKSPENYFYQERLWHLAGDEYPAGTSRMLKDNLGYGEANIAANPLRDWSKSSSVASMVGKLVIDPEIVEVADNRYKVFQQAIQTAFQLLYNKSMYAWAICQKAADTVGYDLFEDPRGNIVFQAPKYDKLPRLNDVGLGLPGSPELDIDRGYYTENYSNVPYHARDYIIDDIGLKTRRYTYTEDGTVTYVSSAALLDWVNTTDELINAECFKGSTSYSSISKLSSELAEQLVRLNRRFGVRRHEMEPMVTGSIKNKELLNRWALQELIKLNAGAVVGTVELHQRPDLWIGRTVFLVEDQLLAYIVGTTNSYNRSGQQPHNTTLSLAYVHHPSQLIGVPWQLATATEANLDLPSEQKDALL